MPWEPRRQTMDDRDVVAYEAIVADSRAIVAIVQDMWERADEERGTPEAPKLQEGARWRTSMISAELQTILQRLRNPTAREQRLFGKVG